MRNHGNWIVSISQLGRFLGRAGRGGRRDDPAGDGGDEAARRARPRRRRPHRRQGARARRRAARRTSSRAPTSSRRSTVLAEGTQGHLTGAAIDHFGLEGREPADLGARRQGGLEGRRSRSTGSSTRWAGRCARARSTASSAARRSTRWARTWSRSASSSGSTTATSSSPRTTCCRSSRRTQLVRKILDGRRADRVGREDDPRGRLPLAADAASTRPGCCSSARAPGSSTCRALKGDPLRDRVRDGSRPRRPSSRCSAARRRRGSARSTATTRRCARATSGRTSREVRNMRQAFDKGFFVGGALASAMTVTKGRFPPKERRDAAERRAAAAPHRARRSAIRRPTASSRSTSSRPSSRRATGRATTSRTTSGSQTRVPRDVAEMWARMCPAQVYEVGDDDGDGTVTVERDAVELRPVRRDHRQGRPPDAARGRLRARVQRT